MKRVLPILILSVLLVACGPDSPDETIVRILADDTPMFQGDQTIVYDELETYLAADTECVELDASTFNVQGIAVDMGYLQCGETTGWVHTMNYRVK